MGTHILFDAGTVSCLWSLTRLYKETLKQSEGYFVVD